MYQHEGSNNGPSLANAATDDLVPAPNNYAQTGAATVWVFPKKARDITKNNLYASVDCKEKFVAAMHKHPNFAKHLASRMDILRASNKVLKAIIIEWDEVGVWKQHWCPFFLRSRENKYAHCGETSKKL
jgi:hypothetical protein